MRTIWKYPLRTGVTKLELPCDSTVLMVDTQDDYPFVWVEVDTTQPLEEREFVAYGTGHEMMGDREHQYIGTFQLNNGELIFHLYEFEQQTFY